MAIKIRQGLTLVSLSTEKETLISSILSNDTVQVLEPHRIVPHKPKVEIKKYIKLQKIDNGQ